MSGAGWWTAAESAHTYAVGAAVEGLRDPALGAARLTGAGVTVLAEAAVSSATPYLRAPLLALLHEALVLHQPDGSAGAPPVCSTCRVVAPCPTTAALTSSPPAG